MAELDARQTYWLLTFGRFEEDEMEFVPALAGPDAPNRFPTFFRALERYSPLKLRAK